MKTAFIKVFILALAWASHPAQGETSEYQSDVQVKPLLKTTTTSLGQPILYPQTAEVTALEVEIAPGKETGWHSHPVPGYGYILSGSVVIEMEGGEQSRFDAGDAFVEVINTMHNGKNLGARSGQDIGVLFRRGGEALYRARDEGITAVSRSS